MTKAYKRYRGIVLPIVIVLSLIILTSVSIWYRKVILQSFLSERLILQRIAYKECNSLIPILKAKLKDLPKEEFERPEDKFLTVEDEGKVHWTVDRSAWAGKKIVFTFKPSNQLLEPIRLTIGYSGEEN